MFDQYLYFSNIVIGNACASVTMQNSGTLTGITFRIVPLIVLGAGDECWTEWEVSTNNTIAQSSQMSPPNGVIAKGIAGAVCDIAGTSINQVLVADETQMVPPRKVVAGQIFYVNSAALATRAGGVANYSGYIIFHVK